MNNINYILGAKKRWARMTKKEKSNFLKKVWVKRRKNGNIIPWLKNLRVLCPNCHARKSTIDKGEIALWKRNIKSIN